jgi:hypothetical protein
VSWPPYWLSAWDPPDSGTTIRVFDDLPPYASVPTWWARAIYEDCLRYGPTRDVRCEDCGARSKVPECSGNYWAVGWFQAHQAICPARVLGSHHPKPSSGLVSL